MSTAHPEPRGDAATYERILAHALALPEAWEDNPWGERAIKVRKKVFVFSGAREDGGFGISVKLPVSREEALAVGGKPTGYGLGKAGWVSLSWSPGGEVPLDLVLEWIEESYRAVAPKALARQLG